jgi:hypothetical protein
MCHQTIHNADQHMSLPAITYVLWFFKYCIQILHHAQVASGPPPGSLNVLPLYHCKGDQAAGEGKIVREPSSVMVRDTYAVNPKP